MADAKISALPAASTPLAGTEVLPIVQSGVTDKVSIANLTAGRAVSAASLTLTTTPLTVANGGTGRASFTANGIVYASGTTTLASGSALTFNGTNLATTGSATAASFIPSGSTVPTNGMYLSTTNTLAWATNSGSRMTLNATGTLTVLSNGHNLKVNNTTGNTSEVEWQYNTSTVGNISIFQNTEFIISSTGSAVLEIGTAAGTIATLGTTGLFTINKCFGRGAPVTKTGDFTLGATENWVIVNQAGTTTVTLPAASSWTGREVMFKTIQNQTLVSASSNVVPLAGGAAGTAILAATAGKWATCVSDGTNWILMAGN